MQHTKSILCVTTAFQKAEINSVEVTGVNLIETAQKYKNAGESEKKGEWCGNRPLQKNS